MGEIVRKRGREDVFIRHMRQLVRLVLAQLKSGGGVAHISRPMIAAELGVEIKAAGRLRDELKQPGSPYRLIMLLPRDGAPASSRWYSIDEESMFFTLHETWARELLVRAREFTLDLDAPYTAPSLESGRKTACGTAGGPEAARTPFASPDGVMDRVNPASSTDMSISMLVGHRIKELVSDGIWIEVDPRLRRALTPRWHERACRLLAMLADPGLCDWLRTHRADANRFARNLEQGRPARPRAYLQHLSQMRLERLRQARLDEELERKVMTCERA